MFVMFSARYWRTLLITLCSALLIVSATASGSLPTADELRQQLEDLSDAEDAETVQQRRQLEDALGLLSDIDRHRQRIATLELKAIEHPQTLAQLNQQLQQTQEQTHAPVDNLSIEQSIQQLTAALEKLEENQALLAELNTELTRLQTLPERTQNALNNALSRLDDIRHTLLGSIRLPEWQQMTLHIERQALETSVTLQHQELSVSDQLREQVRLRLRLAQRQTQQLRAEINDLQGHISDLRLRQLHDTDSATDSGLPQAITRDSQFQRLARRNQELRGLLYETRQFVTHFIQRAIESKTQLDQLRSQASIVHDQIRLLDSSLLLSRVLYSQQKQLPPFTQDNTLAERIADARLLQFELNQARESLLEVISNTAAPETPLQDALAQLRQDQLDLLRALDTELSRQLTLMVRTRLNQQQLRDISRSLNMTISERTFWMPSTQPLTGMRVLALPGEIIDQASRALTVSWLTLTRSIALHASVGLIPALFFAALLFYWRDSLQTRIHRLNKEVGIRRLDSQTHTPKALTMTALITLAGPVVPGLAGLSLVLSNDALLHTAGSVLFKLALLWWVSLTLRQLIKPDGLAQHHFRWAITGDQFTFRVRLVAWLIAPLLFLTVMAEQWPAQLSTDRIGLLTMLLVLGGLVVTTPLVIKSFPGRIDRPALRQFALISGAAIPLALAILIVVGYYYTAVLLAGRLVETLYVIVLFVILDATAVRGLAVAAQQIAYRRAVAERQAQPREDQGEAVEIEEPKLDLEKINQQSLRLIRLGLMALASVFLYGIWLETFQAFAYTDNIVLFDSVSAQGDVIASDAISLGDIMTALLVGIITYLLATNLPGLLEVMVLSRLDLKQGSSYATTTLLSYVIVSVGTILIFGALGVSWDKLQWLVAALGVGLGFGLQAIFANFVSGLIILFERPIRIGDIITIDDLSGSVSNIRIRATTIIDFDRKEIIVPNQVFITQRLVNWSLSDTVTRVVLKIGFAYGSDLEKCRNILLKAANECERVLKDPEPRVFFLTFGASTLDHELRVHVANIGDRLPTTDYLNRRIDQLCDEQDVEIAFSQLDVHLYTQQGDKLTIKDKEREQKGKTDDEPPEDG